MGIYLSQVVQDFEACKTGTGAVISTKIPQIFDIGIWIVFIDFCLITAQGILWLKANKNGKHEGDWLTLSQIIIVLCYVIDVVMVAYSVWIIRVLRSNQTIYCTKHKKVYNHQVHLCYILLALWVIKIACWIFRVYMDRQKEKLDATYDDD